MTAKSTKLSSSLVIKYKDGVDAKGDENIMIFHPKLAELLGLNESIILSQIHY